jgi:DNA-binding transcriptional ArsR family regulator
MTLKDKIQDEMVTDDETILEAHFERVQKLFQLHEDGTINLEGKYRSLGARLQILIYFIGQRFAYEGELAETDTLNSSYFYDRIDKSDRTIRKYLQELREDGYIKKEGQSEHRLIAENLPSALDQIEEAVGGTDT